MHDEKGRKFNLFDVFGTLSLIVGTLFFIAFVLILPRSWTGSDYERFMGMPPSEPQGITTPDADITLAPTATDTPAPAVLSVENRSRETICELYIEGYADNVLSGADPIETGEHREYGMEPGFYDLSARTCEGVRINVVGFEVQGQAVWVINDD